MSRDLSRHTGPLRRALPAVIFPALVVIVRATAQELPARCRAPASRARNADTADAWRGAHEAGNDDATRHYFAGGDRIRACHFYAMLFKGPLERKSAQKIYIDIYIYIYIYIFDAAVELNARDGALFRRRQRFRRRCSSAKAARAKISMVTVGHHATPISPTSLLISLLASRHYMIIMPACAIAIYANEQKQQYNDDCLSSRRFTPRCSFISAKASVSLFRIVLARRA